jgi:hypothetical protein
MKPPVYVKLATTLLVFVLTFPLYEQERCVSCTVSVISCKKSVDKAVPCHQGVFVDVGLYFSEMHHILMVGQVISELVND